MKCTDLDSEGFSICRSRGYGHFNGSLKKVWFNSGFVESFSDILQLKTTDPKKKFNVTVDEVNTPELSPYNTIIGTDLTGAFRLNIRFSDKSVAWDDTIICS